MAISMLKIRRPLGRLIFNMGIAIPGKTVFLILRRPPGYGYGANSLISTVFLCAFIYDNKLMLHCNTYSVQITEYYNW